MLTIPARLKEKLELDQLLFGEVSSSIAKFTPWFADNKLVFFPEYTDHGINHLQEVLNTSSSIITDESWDLLTSQDAAAIIIGTLLHDCAMHLSEDGFYDLISDSYPEIKSRYNTHPETSWKKKWLSFFSEAKRWDGKKLNSIFGDTTPIHEIALSKNDLTRRSRLLIGEFLRREHANLAHSISLNGVPSTTSKKLHLDITDQNFRDLVGFIAKSHNMSIRSATDRLGVSLKRTAFNVHAPFVMSVLRISDYIQVHSSRAQNQLLAVKRLTSPISRGEWDKHNSILDINQTHDDPEALYIEAEPKDPLTFKSLKKLFNDIQNELDSTWSVLGEVYGRFRPYDKLGINIRRIKSSLDDELIYIKNKKPNFVPTPVSFKTSDAEMLSLLVAPLYGNDPSIGVRELIQNSVDACNERIDYFDKTNWGNYTKEDINVTIKISKNGDSPILLKIVDKGIGMDLSIIKNYFLNVGASFRNSDSWKEKHETDGHSNVHRTGRFGVGLLAAFLLGSEIKVQTRHINEKHGYKFKCTKDSDDISLFPIECDIGTTITIEITDEVFNILKENNNKDWDWYCLGTPKVTRILEINGEEKILDQIIKVPSSGDTLDGTNWFRIQHPDFDDIFWSTEKIREKYYSQSIVVCNGIKIPNTDHRDIFRIKKSYSILNIGIINPSLVVYDQDNKMPINLTRNGFTSEELPFNNELIYDISFKLAKEIHDIFHIKYDNLDSDVVSLMLTSKLEYFTTKYRHSQLSTLNYFNDKIYPSNINIIHSQKPKSIFIDTVSDQDKSNSAPCFNKIKNNTIYSFYNSERRSRTSNVSYLRTIFENDPYSEYFPLQGKRLFIKNSEIDSILTPGSFPKYLWARFSLEWTDNEWSIMKIGQAPKLDWDYKEVSKLLSKTSQKMFSLIYFNWDDEYTPPEETIFYKAWTDLLSLKNI